MLSPLDSLLKLPGVTVEGHTQVEGYICLHLKIQRQEITCPHCTKLTKELHQVRPILVRDLPTFGQAVYLRVPRRQFYQKSWGSWGGGGAGGEALLLSSPQP